jgi:outer membrane receptor protein involved in Fe transport
MELRRDRGAFSYGIAVSDRAKFTFFRTDELDSNRNLGPYGTAFAEYRPGPKTTIRLDIDNLFDTAAQRHRSLYIPDRTSADPTFNELRQRNIHTSIMLTLKRSFGGGSKESK